MQCMDMTPEQVAEILKPCAGQRGKLVVLLPNGGRMVLGSDDSEVLAKTLARPDGLVRVERSDGSWLVLDPGAVAAVAWQPDNADDDFAPVGPYV